MFRFLNAARDAVIETIYAIRNTSCSLSARIPRDMYSAGSSRAIIFFSNTPFGRRYAIYTTITLFLDVIRVLKNALRLQSSPCLL